MSNQLVVHEPAAQKPSALVAMATNLGIESDKMLATLKATVFKGATNEEAAALVVVSNQYQLNPFLKEIYAFPAKGGGIVPVVSVDGWISIMNRAENFDGIEFTFEEADPRGAKPISCTATIWLKDRERPVVITEYFDECYRNTDPWNKMPRRMLRNRTSVQAARIAFGFSGIYLEDEAETFSERPTIKRAVVNEAPATAAKPESLLPARRTEADSASKAEPKASAAKKEEVKPAVEVEATRVEQEPGAGEEVGNGAEEATGNAPDENQLPPLCQKLMAKVREHGDFSEQKVAKLLAVYRLCPKETTSLAEVEEKSIQLALDEIDTLVDDLKQFKD